MKLGTSPIFNISSSHTQITKIAADELLNSDNDKSDYDWLLTPPGTPLFPSLEMGSQKTVMSQVGNPTIRSPALKSRLADPQPEQPARGSLVSRQSASSPVLNNSSSGGRRPSSSGGPGSRPSTPTGRCTLTTSSKPSRSAIPTSRLTLSSNRPALSATRSTASTTKLTPSATKRSTSVRTLMVSGTNSTVPVNKGTVPAAKTTVPSRSSTPSRSTTRSSTPSRSTTRSSTPFRSTAPCTSTARSSTPSRSTTLTSSTPASRPSSILPTNPVARTSTPTRRPSRPSSVPNVSAPPVKSSPSATKPALTTSRSSVPSHSSSPTVKSRPWNPSKMPGFLLDAPPNLRTSVTERPDSTTRGRPGAPSPRSSSVEPVSNGRPRRQSCSPSRVRAPNGSMHPGGSSVPAVSRGYSKVNDNVSPGVVGAKMVERVINVRKLAPPKQDDKNSPCGKLTGKASSPDSSGFGRTLSKKSMDMAIRQMDIRRSIPCNLRPLMTNIPASFMYSVRSGPRSIAISVSDPPCATSSTASSELSVNDIGICMDICEMEDDIACERCGRSPATMRGR